MTVRSIKLKLEGLRKVSWLTNTVNPHPVVQKKTFHTDERTLFPQEGSSSSSHRIGSGYHEWAFKFELAASLPESVEGLPGSYIVYEITATVDRGYMTKDLVARKRIRVIRTLGMDSLDTFTLEQINEDIWVNKISYKITVPKVNFMYGTSVTADFVLTPIKKGVRIGQITMEVVEKVIVAVDYGAGPAQSHSTDTIVSKKSMDMPEGSEVYLPEQEEIAGPMYDESYHFQMTLPFEKNLNKCRQSVDTDTVKIDHKLRIYVSLHNPEGHVSQLLVKNMLNLFISPNVPIGEDSCLQMSPTVEQNAQMATDQNLEAPPTYGSHQLDMLYDELDASGLQTPGIRSTTVSGWSTPLYAGSRNASHENLASMDAVANGTGADSPNGGASASALQARLASLQEQHTSRSQHHINRSGLNSPHNGVDDAHSGTSSRQSNSAHHSRRPSGQGNTYSINHDQYDMDALARIPSYNTAVRTPAAQTPGTYQLPTYDVAVSRPPSPTLQDPPSAHTHRSGINTPSDSGSLCTVREVRDALPQRPAAVHQRASDHEWR